jgi:uncharacterized membrane protein YoaK (UPF0700 family)
LALARRPVRDAAQISGNSALVLEDTDMMLDWNEYRTQLGAAYEDISPLAGKPAPKEMLVDLSRLEKEHFERRPDLDDPTQSSTRRRWSGAVSPGADLAIRALPFVLSVIAGATDIIGFLGLNGLFTAHITGNIVVLAAHIVAGDPTIFSHILSVPVFMLVLFLTRLLAGALERAGRDTLGPLLLLQLLALAVFLGLCITAGPWINPNTANAVCGGMLGVGAMAVQHVLVQISLRNTPSTAVMTTNVTHFMLDLGGVLVGSDSAEVAKARSRAVHTLPVIVGFATGCGLGAAYEAAAGLWSLTLPTGFALLALAMGLVCRRRA